MKKRTSLSKSGLTIAHLLEVADETLALCREKPQRGPKLTRSYSETQLWRSLIQGQLSNSERLLMVARYHFEFTTEMRLLKSIHVPWKTLKAHSDGWLTCLLMISLIEHIESLLEIAYQSD
jgi:hypothetical protein